MKSLILVMAISVFAAPAAFAGSRRYSSDDVYVSGHYRSNGTYVEPHYRSAPNANRWDNYGYTPSQPQYNSSYSNPYSNKAPNPGRLNDNNPYNDAPGFGGYKRDR
jgi:hypothetical protein